MIFDNIVVIFFKKFLRKHSLKFLALLFLQGASILFLLIYPVLTKFLIDDVFINKDFSLLFNLIVFTIIIYILSAISSYFQNYVQGKLEIELFKDISTCLYDVVTYSELNHFHKMKKGDLMYRLLNNSQSTITIYVDIFPEFLISILTLVSPLIVMIYLNLYLSILTLSPVILFFIFSVVFGNKIQYIENDLLDNYGNLYNKLDEGLQNILLIKSFNLQKWATNKFKKQMNMYYVNFIKLLKISSLNIFINDLLNELPTIILLIFGGIYVLKGYITIGTFTAFMGYIAIFFSPISQLSQSWTKYKSELPALYRLMELLELNNEKENGIPFTNSVSKISFNNVCFSYDSKIILDNLNFTFKQGLNFVIGDNGLGKSTIFKLISRFYEPTSGSIYFDDVNIKDYEVYGLRNNITLLFSEPELFNGSILENIQIGDFYADFTKIVDASKKANIHDFIMNLPQEYDTIVGENGFNLSSGEKQKISLARCFLKNSPILLLDEITNSLDDHSKNEILLSLKEFESEKIIIMITHDLDDVIEGSNILNLNAHM